MSKALITEIVGFMDRHQLEPTPAGIVLLKDGHLVHQLMDEEKPRKLRRKTAAKIRARIAEIDADPSALKV